MNLGGDRLRTPPRLLFHGRSFSLFFSWRRTMSCSDCLPFSFPGGTRPPLCHLSPPPEAPLLGGGPASVAGAVRSLRVAWDGGVSRGVGLSVPNPEGLERSATRWASVLGQQGLHCGVGGRQAYK